MALEAMGKAAEQTIEEAEIAAEGSIQKFETGVKALEGLTEADLKAAIRWIMGALPPSIAQSFYEHHPKFRA